MSTYDSYLVLKYYPQFKIKTTEMKGKSMNINPMALVQLQHKFSTFKIEHPKVAPFFGALKESSLTVGTVFDMKVTTPDGREMQCNIKVTQNDIDLFNTIMEMGSQNR